MVPPQSNQWFALMIGNSRQHWALFTGEHLSRTWHLTPEEFAFNPAQDYPNLPCWGASVGSVSLHQVYPTAIAFTLEDIPIPRMYPTLGIDRALALWGALQVYGAPVCVVDAGTALTLTLANDRGDFAGGVILPGVGLMARALADYTAALPYVTLPPDPPPRWGTTTTTAIESGLYYGTAAMLHAYLGAFFQAFPQGTVIVTGGDRPFLSELLKTFLDADRWHEDDHLVFWGIRALRNPTVKIEMHPMNRIDDFR
ncbi:MULTISPECIES: pantothenate kinase [unclassified Thermosynechococcus]|uniref:pantothenate kinase n=1 Tax=unclassified Thermosynechococcus TaxID=2622553 RepID=UPI002872CD2E|nr:MULTISPECIES: pantothenate kinase [unclassified Thermosynechococcus]WNC22226.1 pantothenate kinase [Thermosynechococcus sp. PP22]WNC32463.1 pantothenate kinase [Thermosynechococcus sp. PKX95]WNC34993.1 pantothenate kinase [Thermosynechococcus sp. PKX91]WNC37509.1 pantothenate kinase [Thermosynechococcus sp. WL11]WNC40031.1 pantothenate kinase [Thermosynechococcus sp. WL17]